MNTMKKYLLLFLIFIVGVFGLTCNANATGCKYVNGYKVKTEMVNIGDVVAQRDIPVGTVIKRITSTALANQGNIIRCSGDAPKVMLYSNSTFPTYQYQGITYFSTGIEGIGLRMTSNSTYWQGVWNGGRLPIRLTGGSCLWIHWDFTDANEFCGGSWGKGGVNFELVKTAERTGSGRIHAPGTLIEASIEGHLKAFRFNLMETTVNTIKCSVTTPVVNLNIGEVDINSFRRQPGAVSIQKNTKSMGLMCDPGTNINVTVNGRQNSDTTDTSVLALTDQYGDGTAKGVGVQLLYNNVPLRLNQRIELKTSSGGQEMLPITARYFQTLNDVTTGEANASATMVLTYQ